MNWDGGCRIAIIGRSDLPSSLGILSLLSPAADCVLPSCPEPRTQRISSVTGWLFFVAGIWQMSFRERDTVQMSNAGGPRRPPLK